MQRRDLMGGIVAAVTAAASGLGAGPARADHRLAPAAHRLDNATEALLEALTRTAHHQGRGERHDANDELLAVMAAGALYGQARAVHELIEEGVSEPGIFLAAREMDRQMRLAQQRILHAHTSQIVRTRFRSVAAAMDAFLSQTGGRRGPRDYDYDRYERGRDRVFPDRDDRHDH